MDDLEVLIGFKYKGEEYKGVYIIKGEEIGNSAVESMDLINKTERNIGSVTRVNMIKILWKEEL